MRPTRSASARAFILICNEVLLLLERKLPLCCFYYYCFFKSYKLLDCSLLRLP